MKLKPIESVSLAAQAQRIDASVLAAWANSPLDDSIKSALGHFLITKPSNNTRNAYSRDIIEFLTHCSQLGSQITRMSEISEKLILLWKDSLNKKHSKYDDSRRRVASSSVARKLCALSSFLDFAVRRKLIAVSPFEHITRPRVRRQSHATILTDDEIRSIIETCRSKLILQRAQPVQDTPKGREQLLKVEMEWCILILLFTVGMRVSELCSLTLGDISREGDLIRLHLLTKGGLRHNPLIHPDTATVLLNYLALAHPHSIASDPLFPASRKGRSGKPQPSIHRSSVFRVVQNAAREAGIARAFSPHGCRATLATQLHLSEVPVVEIQSLLNHAQVTTTQLYLHRVHELQEAASLKLPWSEEVQSRPLVSKAE